MIAEMRERHWEKDWEKTYRHWEKDWEKTYKIGRASCRERVSSPV